MPWTFYNSAGQKLSTAATSIDVLDINGATDIGADIANGDLLIIDDGAGGTNRKTTVDRLKTYVGSAVTREGGNTSEVTTTSTSADNLLAIASLSIAAATPLVAHVLVRKTAGASNHPVWGYTVNTTSIGAGMGIGSTDNEIQEGMKLVFIPARVSSYTFAGPIVPGRTSDQSGNNARATIEAGSSGSGPMQQAFPTATVTDFKIDGNSQTSITFVVDELHLYSWATS